MVSLSKVAKEKFVTILVQMTHASPCYILYLCVSSIVLQKVFIYYTDGSKNWGNNSAMLKKKICGVAVCTFIVKGLKKKSNFKKRKLSSLYSKSYSGHFSEYLRSPNNREISPKFHFMSHFRASLMLQIE